MLIFPLPVVIHQIHGLYSLTASLLTCPKFLKLDHLNLIQSFLLMNSLFFINDLSLLQRLAFNIGRLVFLLLHILYK